MARRTVSRKEIADQISAAEAAEAEAPVKKKKKAAKKKAKRTSRAKKTVEVRLKAFWGVFNQSGKQVDRFEYSDRDAADKRAQALSKTAETVHFVQLVKEVINE